MSVTATDQPEVADHPRERTCFSDIEDARTSRDQLRRDDRGQRERGRRIHRRVRVCKHCGGFYVGRELREVTRRD